ncbi:ATP-binding protein [bacterium]|nr:ATP-binding protein [bacterium]MCI0605433.1 ATP-binding protein [bacterium]
MLNPQDDLKQKLIWLMTLRMVIIITLLGSAILIQLVSRTILPINPLYFLIFLTSIFTLFYGFLFNRIPDLKLLAYMQLSGDVLVITLLLYFTGGVKSSFSFLYILVIISSSILLYRRGSLYIASISSVFYGLLVVLVHYRVLPYYDLDVEEIAGITYRMLYYYIFMHLFAFYSTAMMSSYLSERLRRTRTALEEMDEDLSDLRLLHQKIIDSMTAGLVITDLERQINFVNEPGIRILRLPIQDLLGKQIDKLFLQEINMERVVEALKTNSFTSLERVLIKDKQGILVGMNISYLQSQKGSPTGYMVIFQDITEGRKMERQFRLQERMAAIGTMAAGIAHEIRNPLASIRGSVQLLQSELVLSEDQRKLMEIVLTESTRLDQTIQNFLNYAKPKQLSTAVEDLKEIVSDMLNFIQKGPEFKEGHRIEFLGSEENFLHEVDSNQIKQVIWNLSINALRAMPEGGKLTVTLSHDLPGDIILSFRDEGRGIEPERIESIFDPFQDSTTGGSGLGMAIVYRIVQDHHGHIFIESTVSRGTTITVRLPANANVSSFVTMNSARAMSHE